MVGTRPNFIKVTRFKEVALKYSKINLKIVHTGQHFDDNMAQIFFQQFKIIPDFFLNPVTGSAAARLGEIMIQLEALMQNDFRPDLLLVVGDVDSTLAAAITGTKMKIPVGHIESGLRSYDKNMPEEFNRIVTDHIADYHFTTEPAAKINLAREHIPEHFTYMVGNTMIDTLVAFGPQIESCDILAKLHLTKKGYMLVTIHRPSMVDTYEGLQNLTTLLESITENGKTVFPIHPRTLNNLKKYDLYNKLASNPGLIITLPLDYFSFQKLIKYCCYIITDSGGIQEESTFLRVPCLTLRNNTERPITCTKGTNTLIPFDLPLISQYISQIESGTYKKGEVPNLWDGHATERIFEVLDKL